MKFYFTLLIFILILFNTTLWAQYAIREAYPALTFAYPIEMVVPTDTTNRIFVLEKGGKIIVFNNTQSVNTSKVFLDISDRVSTHFYAGLFGIAFHPSYQSNRYFYVYYTSGSGTDMMLTISRFTTSPDNPDSALKSSALVLLTVPAPSSNHNGSVIRFGPDGYLYFGFGDSSPGSGGDPNNKAQNKSEIFGKMNRINVDSTSGGRNYSIPQTNPYYENTSGYREEIYAYGFRNMWKFSFDLTTGKLWLADVGQSRWEEVNVVENGKNYGWRLKEGNVCFNPSTNCDTGGVILTDPLYSYPHSLGASITGGYVYRGSQMPGLFGKYIYSDYTSGRIWALSWDGINPPTNQELFDSPYGVVSFGEDKQKNLYFLHFNATAGKIYKIVDTTLTFANTGTEEPLEFFLSQNYPNPFNPGTIISYSLGNESFVSLKVYDAVGREVAELVQKEQRAGNYNIEWNASDHPSGIYYYELRAKDFLQTKRMLLIK